MSSTPAPSSAFTPPALSSAAPDPTSSAAAASPAPGPTSGSSSLYLYTFLATLLLLLCVSGLIVFRGVLVRRRARAALADGTWVPDAPRGAGLSEKPRMHEVWLRPGADEGYADMAPVAGSIEKDKPKDKPKPAPPPAPRARLIQRALRFAPLSFAHAPRIPLSAPAPAPPPAKDTAADDTGSDALARGADACVALLVAMPCLRVVKKDEEGLPVLEIGVVRVRVG